MQGACTLRLQEAQSGPVPCSGARRQNKVLDKVSAENAKDEQTQKPPNTLILQKIGSAFVVCSILLLCDFITCFIHYSLVDLL
jgi:hypothetical protein